MLMGLRGTPFLYYGDELGMPDTPIPRERILDPVGLLFEGHYGRDPERTPMQWDTSVTGGFSSPGVEPWLPYGDVGGVQRRGPAARSVVDAVTRARSGRVARCDPRTP